MRRETPLLEDELRPALIGVAAAVALVHRDALVFYRMAHRGDIGPERREIHVGGARRGVTTTRPPIEILGPSHP